MDRGSTIRFSELLERERERGNPQNLEGVKGEGYSLGGVRERIGVTMIDIHCKNVWNSKIINKVLY